MGPLTITRAAVAQAFNGDTIRKISISAFDLSADGQLHFKQTERGNLNNDNIAFWVTNTQGQRKLYQYKKLSIEYAEARGIIDSLHALLARVSKPGQVLQLQKAIPPSLYDDVDTRRLLEPSKALIKAVVCDGQRDNNTVSQPVLSEKGRCSKRQFRFALFLTTIIG